MAKKRHLKVYEILTYALGLFGLQAVVGYFNSFQAEFYVSVLGADFVIIAVLLLVVKLVSAAFDPVVGNLIERTKSKYGKLKPFIAASILPLAGLTVLTFLRVPFRGAGLYAYIFFIFLFWNMAVTLGDVPATAFGSVLTPDAEERSVAVSLAAALKSGGLFAGTVIVPIICAMVPGGSAGFAANDDPISNTEYLVSAAVTAGLGLILLALILFFNKERVPYQVEKMTYRDMGKCLKDNKPLMLLTLSCFFGCCRMIQSGIAVQAANAVLGGQNLTVVLGLACGVGGAVSLVLVGLGSKWFGEKKTYIGLSIFGFIASMVTVLVGTEHVIAMFSMLFFVGLQFGAVNIMPMTMTADCVDYYEYKTGKRTEGAAYAVLTMTTKITLAVSVGAGLLILGLSGYDPNAVVQTERAKNIVYFAYAGLPGVFSLLSVIPMFKYDLTGEKKKIIAEELARRRAAKEAGEDYAPVTDFS